MRRLILVLLLAVAAPAAAQTPEPAPPPQVVQTPATAGEAPEYEAAPAGLPQRVAPPRTLRAYWHLFAAFAITWLLLFGYAISIGRRFARLEEELRRLRS